MSKPWDSRHIETLTEAVDVNDMPTVRELIQNLVAHVYSDFRIYPANEAGDILNVLRHRRHFDEMREAADAFLITDARRSESASTTRRHCLTSDIWPLPRMY